MKGRPIALAQLKEAAGQPCLCPLTDDNTQVDLNLRQIVAGMLLAFLLESNQNTPNILHPLAKIHCSFYSIT